MRLLLIKDFACKTIKKTILSLHYTYIKTVKIYVELHIINKD